MTDSTYTFKNAGTTHGYQIDSTLIKIFLNVVKEGDLQSIKSNIERYSFDVKQIKDEINDQNLIFTASAIKDDAKAKEVMKFFVDLGVDACARDKIFQTALYYTARDGKYQCCEFLIENGCPLNEKDLYNQTPIYYAAREGHLDVCHLLVEKGSDLNVEDKYGQNCIYYSIREGRTEVVDFLIKQGIDFNKEDKKKQTPLSYAIKQNKNDIVSILEKAGAKMPDKNDKKAKKDKKKTESHKEESEKGEVTPTTYSFYRIENDKLVPLTNEELEQFYKVRQDIADLMNNPEKLEKLEIEASNELKASPSWEKHAKKIMSNLWKFKDAELFHRPVNPVELGIPDYPDIIKNPMDFSTIKKKLNSGLYNNFEAFNNDVNLTFNNCFLYNGEKSVIGIMCSNVKGEYERLISLYNMAIYL